MTTTCPVCGRGHFTFSTGGNSPAPTAATPDLSWLYKAVYEVGYAAGYAAAIRVRGLSIEEVAALSEAQARLT
jgi:hypothetical protein